MDLCRLEHLSKIVSLMGPWQLWLLWFLQSRQLTYLPHHTLTFDLWEWLYFVYFRVNFLEGCWLIDENIIIAHMNSSTFTQAVSNGVIDKEFVGNDSLRHFLRDVICIDPAERVSLQALRQRALMTGGHSISASKIYGGVEQIQQDMKTLMTLTEDGLTKANKSMENLISAGFIVSPTVENMNVTFPIVMSSCSDILNKLHNCASKKRD